MWDQALQDCKGDIKTKEGFEKHSQCDGAYGAVEAFPLQQEETHTILYNLYIQSRHKR